MTVGLRGGLALSPGCSRGGCLSSSSHDGHLARHIAAPSLVSTPAGIQGGFKSSAPSRCVTQTCRVTPSDAPCVVWSAAGLDPAPHLQSGTGGAVATRPRGDQEPEGQAGGALRVGSATNTAGRASWHLLAWPGVDSGARASLQGPRGPGAHWGAGGQRERPRHPEALPFPEAASTPDCARSSAAWTTAPGVTQTPVLWASRVPRCKARRPHRAGRGAGGGESSHPPPLTQTPTPAGQKLGQGRRGSRPGLTPGGARKAEHPEARGQASVLTAAQPSALGCWS